MRIEAEHYFTLRITDRHRPCKVKTQRTTEIIINLLHCFPSCFIAWSPQETPSLTVSSCEKAATLAEPPVTPSNTFTGEHILPFNDSKTVREARQHRVAQVLGGSPISSVPEAGSSAVTRSPTEQTASTANCVSTQVRYDLGQGCILSRDRVAYL